MFRSLSHEEERQGVAGKVEEPLSLPGGAGLRVRRLLPRSPAED
ncbi:MAG: hypothetical protein ACLR7Z_19095 [Bilophila wadsworthia]